MKAREDAAQRIFENGSCLVDLENGFELAIHQELPDAPRSPFYLNLRPMGVKGGEMKPSDINAVAKSMELLGESAGLFKNNRPICDIPAAGTPYLDAILDRLAKKEGGQPVRFTMKKRLINEKRTFALSEEYDMSDDRWQRTCMVDDLVASSLTKKLAMEPITQAGGKVTDLLLFLDRSTDAKKELGKLGVTVHAAWDFPHLMEWALGKGHLNRKQYEVIMEYPSRLDEYKKSVRCD
jgi:orotate phosphoribosyltransferase